MNPRSIPPHPEKSDTTVNFRCPTVCANELSCLDCIKMVSQLKLFSGHPYLRRSLSRLELPIRVHVTPDEYVESIGFTAHAYIMNLITKRDLMKNSERYLGEFLEHLIRG